MKEQDKNFCIQMAMLSMIVILLLMVAQNNFQRKAENSKISILQEKLQDEQELLNFKKEVMARNKWMYDNICIYNYETYTLRTLAVSDGEIQIKIEPLPGIYIDGDNLMVEINHSLKASYTKEFLTVRKIDVNCWRFNVSVDDSTEHVFSFSNGTQERYVLYVTKELEPLNGHYFMPIQWEFIIDRSW